ncbi:MAG: hypothetical protein ACLS6Y_07435 [Streptococcus salivarius]
MKTLKSIINAFLFFIAIYGLAMLALLILPFVDVTNLFQVLRFITFLDGVTGWSQSYNLPSILP